MQIKPSVIEKHEKIERPLVPLPPVPKKVSPANKAVPVQNQQVIMEIKKTDKLEKKDMISPPSTAFSKKRSSFALGGADKKEPLKVEEVRVGKPLSKKKEKP
mgnify:CR=1 FL=1